MTAAGKQSHATEHAASLRALAGTMLRGSAAVVVAVVVLAVVGALVLVGPVGAWSALIGGGVACGMSLLTLWLIARTAAIAPSAVMLASFAGLLLKVIILLVVFVLVGRAEDIHRESLAVAMSAVFVVAAAAQARAGARMRTLTVIPDPGPGSAPTSGTEESQMSGPDVEARTGASGATSGDPRDDHAQ